jgi:hypothetical protein
MGPFTVGFAWTLAAKAEAKARTSMDAFIKILLSEGGEKICAA